MANWRIDWEMFCSAQDDIVCSDQA